jgi:hypothetical protein
MISNSRQIAAGKQLQQASDTIGKRQATTTSKKNK